MKRKISFLCLILLIFASLTVTACTQPHDDRISSYKKIPTVTAEEIQQMEELLATKPRLVYGIGDTVEAFTYSDGSVGGFANLFAQRLTELFEFEIDFVVCGWQEMNDKLMAKEIDIVADLTASPERLEKLLMSGPIIQRTVKSFTLVGSESLETIQKNRKVKAAFLSNTTTIALVESVWHIDHEYIEVDDFMEIPNMLQNGEIDVFIGESIIETTFDSFDFMQSEDFYPLVYSPVSLATANKDLAPFMDVFEKYLDNGGSYELTELLTKGYKEYVENKIQLKLTDEEKAYIQSHNTQENAIKVGYESSNYPSSFYNDKEKEFQGIGVDIISQVSDLTGLKFTAGNKQNDTWANIMTKLESGEYSLVAELLKSKQREGRFLWANLPCYSDNLALISKTSYPEINVNQVLFSKIGLIKGSVHTEVFNEWFPDSNNTTMFNTADEAIKALENDEIGLLMASQNLLLYLVNYQEKTDYKTNIAFNYSTDSYIGFNKDEVILQSIFNKTLRYVDRNAISSRWQQKSFDYSSKFLRDLIPYLVTFLAMLSLGITVILLLFIKNKLINKNLQVIVDERTKEISLQASMLSIIFDSIPDLAFCKDKNFNFTRCNKGFEEYFNRKEKDIVGKDYVLGLGMDDDLAKFLRSTEERVISEGILQTEEVFVPSAKGELNCFETIKTPLIQDGKVVGVMGIARNITQRKESEEALQLVLNNLDSLIYITEVETDKILFVNKAMAKEFGNDVLTEGKRCWEVFQKDFTQRCSFCPVPKLLDSGEKYTVWDEINTVTGKYYKNTDSIINWTNGKLVHMQHSIDVTSAVELQQKLEYASKAKSDFLSRMSHEIRTPLNAIIGMNNIAINTDDMKKIKYCHDRIDNASKHLLNVINDILDMSKIEADKFELSESEFSFEKMLINITNVVNFKADEKQQNLVVNLDNNIPEYFIGDDVRLSQVITNLLTNAIKFTPEDGSVVLTVKMLYAEGDDVELQFSVEDNGIGISQEQQSRLFTSFEQADGSISRKFGGTGLGLAISKRIVELMGGAITLESELGKGSKFMFTIRLKKGREVEKIGLSPNINRENVNILAVDDCLETREYFAHFMKAHKLPCDVAESGKEAIEKIRASKDKPFNIFFVDWQMPEMDGVQLTREIKEITGDNSVVIMISVADWNVIEKEALSAGVREFIAKPLYPSALINAVNSCLSNEGALNEEEREKAQNIGRSYKGRCVLIAEDNEINQEIIAAVLEETQLQIDFADNGVIAVEKFKRNPSKYDLVFMDIHMPEMDGYEATRLIRDLNFGNAKRVPIIAMTANVFREDVERCLEAGMNDHVGKPIDQATLFEKMKQYLK